MPTPPLGMPVVYPVPQHGGQRAVSNRAAQPIVRQTTMPATDGRRGLKAASIQHTRPAHTACTQGQHTGSAHSVSIQCGAAQLSMNHGKRSPPRGPTLPLPLPLTLTFTLTSRRSGRQGDTLPPALPRPHPQPQRAACARGGPLALRACVRACVRAARRPGRPVPVPVPVPVGGYYGAHRPPPPPSPAKAATHTLPPLLASSCAQLRTAHAKALRLRFLALVQRRATPLYNPSHMDMYLAATRDIFVTRTKIINFVRRFLDMHGFLEVETPPQPARLTPRHCE